MAMRAFYIGAAVAASSLANIQSAALAFTTTPEGIK
eukprot:CAMPEP_0172537652 /NCGR_PEP_ID=MMETSP1067-20121228/9224_1 /TAXON_ID=265564 ORGANISM="Thalassiosira punctigera, Strain Tpunct2005C2" /NCGR_SAMPLE_ID=MMETSP1067 /ASSEMBLY_ACC=CAM_ASM_000444 /LENGTH=35 /DNA_ID= /DNA_START= /DNA_END= /DNA_ORIENTATION=